MNLKDVAALIAHTTYRTARKGENEAKSNCLYCDLVKQHDGTFSQLLGQIAEWLRKTKGIEKLKARNDIEHMNLDIGVFIDEESMASSYIMPAHFLQSTGDLGLSVTLSVYKKDDKEN